jgi:hypothetical protein
MLKKHTNLKSFIQSKKEMLDVFTLEAKIGEIKSDLLKGFELNTLKKHYLP